MQINGLNWVDPIYYHLNIYYNKSHLKYFFSQIMFLPVIQVVFWPTKVIESCWINYHIVYFFSTRKKNISNDLDFFMFKNYVL